jgi:hypothetical protein
VRIAENAISSKIVLDVRIVLVPVISEMPDLYLTIFSSQKMIIKKRKNKLFRV